MAISTKHPAAAPPTAPPRETTAHLLLRGWCAFVVFSALAGAGWAHALGALGTATLVASASLVSIALWPVLRPGVQWRRLPWLALAFVIWAALPMIWSPAPGAAAVVWMLLTTATVQAMFIAAVLTWRDIVRTIASALKWVIGLSIVFEILVAAFVGGPLLPGFVPAGTGVDPALYWSSGDFFGDSPLEGIVGDPGLLGALMVLAIVVFSIRYATRAPRRPVLLVWIVVAAFILVRSGSIVSLLALAAVTLVLATVLLMRTATRPGERTRYYLLYATAGLAGGSVIWTAFGNDLARTDGAWAEVLTHFGPVGVALLGVALLAFIWRAWFFAIDRPRYDLRADRPYSPLALLPTLLAALLLVEGVAEPAVLLLWGWMLLVLLGAKIKQAPLIGVGPAEQSLAMERGELPKQEA